jgi:hypothetical protein
MAMTARAIQHAVDKFTTEWRWAARLSSSPTLLFDPQRDGRDGDVCHGRVWISNLDSALDVRVLNAAQVYAIILQFHLIADMYMLTQTCPSKYDCKHVNLIANIPRTRMIILLQTCQHDCKHVHRIAMVLQTCPYYCNHVHLIANMFIPLQTEYKPWIAM